MAFAPPSSTFSLPDILAAWPWPRQLNRRYAEAKAASDAWITTFGAFSPKVQQVFTKCDFSLLASLAYPMASAPQLRAACDMMQLCWVFDEYSDREGEDAIRYMAAAIMKGIRHPDIQQNSILGEIARQFGGRAATVLSPTNLERFIQSFQDYTNAIVQRAHDRDHALVRDVDEYFRIRRETIGMRPAFAFLMFDTSVPDDVMNHPTLRRLHTLACDMVILGNDLFSYNKEQANGTDGHNILTIVRVQRGWSLQRALQWLETTHENMVRDFLATKTEVPSFGSTNDAAVRQFIDGIANWVRGNEAWSFESPRYFGEGGLEIQKHRRVELFAKRQLN